MQLVPAWGDSVLMCWGSTVKYENSGLDDDLIAELERWDQAYYDAQQDDGEWRSPQGEAAFEHEGIRLAHRAADALGAGFAVEMAGRTIRSQHSPESPSAAAAFEAHAEREQAELERITNHLQTAGRSDTDLPPAAAWPTEAGAWLRDVASNTTHRVRVNLSPDLYVGFPVEVVVGGKPLYVDADKLGISESLGRDLEEFQDWWERHRTDDEGGHDPSDDAAWEQWVQRGEQLVRRLQTELGDGCYVAWV